METCNLDCQQIILTRVKLSMSCTVMSLWLAVKPKDLNLSPKFIFSF